MADRVRAECRQEVGQPRLQIEGLVAERYGGVTEKQNRDAEDATREPAMPPEPSTSTAVQVNAAEPLDGRDPEPRAGP